MKLQSLPTAMTEGEARRLAAEIVKSAPPQAKATLNDHGSIITIETSKGKVFSAAFVDGIASVQAAPGLVSMTVVAAK